MINPYADDTVDLSGPIKPGVVESGQVSQLDFDKYKGNTKSADIPGSPNSQGNAGALGAAKTAAAGGSADDVAAQGLISSGNPYAMAAGLGLSAFNANQKAQNERANAQYKATLDQQQKMVASAKEGASAWDRMRNLV